MECKVLKPFFDRKEGVSRTAGSLFVCTETRANEINDAFPGTVEKPKRAPRKKADSKEV